jgi:hypothetical protein
MFNIILFKQSLVKNYNLTMTHKSMPNIYINKRPMTNGRARFKNVMNCLNTNTYSYLETSGGQNSNLYLNKAHFFNTSDN